MKGESEVFFSDKKIINWGHFQFLVIFNPTSSVKILRHPNKKTARTSEAKEIYVVQCTLQKHSAGSDIINKQMHVDAFGDISVEPDYTGQIKDYSTVNCIRFLVVFLFQLTDKARYKVSQSVLSVCRTKHKQFINNEKWQKGINITNSNNTLKFSELADVNCECFISANFERQTVNG